MAWNEPGGGNKNQDPWRGRDDQGPPDLDEVVKKLQDRFGGMFGGKNDGGGAGLIGIILFVLALLWAVAGFYRVEEAEKALVLRFGEYHSTTEAGLHWRLWGIDTIYQVDVTATNSAVMKAKMLTEDQNIVEIELNVQYRVTDPKAYFLEAQSPEVALKSGTESALRHVVGGSDMDSVLTEGREAIAIEVENRLQEYVQRYRTGLLITKVNVKDAHPPEQVKASFDDVIKAREDEERLQNEAQSYANGVVPEARGKAQRMIEEANAYKAEVVARSSGEAQRFEKLLTEYQKAPEITKRRLYLETMESVYGNTTKVMVDVDGGNNILYLPLDKIMEQQQMAPLNMGSATNVVTPKDTTSDSSPRGMERLRQIRESRWGGR